MRGHAEQLRRQRLIARIEAMQRAGWRTRADGVDDPDLGGALAELDQLERLTLVRDDLDSGRVPRDDRGGGDEPGGVIATPAVADADQPQTRSMSSFKKCVAQEMQGS
jgi:hypothetical protein